MAHSNHQFDAHSASSFMDEEAADTDDSTQTTQENRTRGYNEQGGPQTTKPRRNTTQTTTIPLGLSESDTPHGNPRDAFRSFYEYWYCKQL